MWYNPWNDIAVGKLALPKDVVNPLLLFTKGAIIAKKEEI